MLRQIWAHICKQTRLANMVGINVPMVKDPKTGKGSVSLSLVFISSLLVVLGLVGKWSGRLGVVDIDNALEFFYASSALYFGRQWTSRSNLESGASKEGTSLETSPEKRDGSNGG